MQQHLLSNLSMAGAVVALTLDAAAMASGYCFSFKCAAARFRLTLFLMSRDCAFSSALKGSSWEIRLSAACVGHAVSAVELGHCTLSHTQPQLPVIIATDLA